MTACKEKGSAVVDVVIAAAMLIFVVLPVFSAVVEKYVLMEKAKIIRDAVDMTNISAYNALMADRLGRTSVNLGRPETERIFRELLRVNLTLDGTLYPEESSIAEGRVEIRSLEIVTSGFPVTCPAGTTLTKPSVHSCIVVPLKPSLYRGVLLSLLGRTSIDIEVHVDSEIPVNH